ncbi:MAG: hypothetical protein LBD20_03515 [Spirochaetaceae bacterium]|jgi:cell fate regulator YaaT (PSP1 superfamily)|nr:hypothetical protein [Spirochaetaceae bacterium]
MNYDVLHCLLATVFLVCYTASMKDELIDEFGDDLEKLEDDERVDDDFIEAVESVDIAPDIPVYLLRLPYAYETFYAVYKGDQIPAKSQVLVPTNYGRDLAVVIGQVKKDGKRRFSKVTRIERPASEDDLIRAQNNIKLEEKAFTACREMITNHGLDEIKTIKEKNGKIKEIMGMKLLAAHYLLEEPKIVFLYTALSRIDFRDLLKDLIAYFKIRIELRQIGIRNRSRIKGGVGICGRPFCCHSFLDKLKHISIKMAKEQKLSLNTTKISGPCNFLLCCIAYEHDFYQEQLKCLPQEGCKINYEGGLWKVSEVNIILGMVTLESEDGRKIFLPKTRFEKTDNRWHIKNEPAKNPS